MPTPHLSIKIIQRSSGQSAVAAAAYQSGQRLYSDYDSAVKDYPAKRGILFSQILLPDHAPPAYAQRNTLWNAVEKAEKQWNSQLARRFELALPREIPPEQYPALVRDYCMDAFVSRGMCVDFAIHDPDPPGHNPHAHVMLTMRALDGNGKWLPKSRKIYDLDEEGNRIRLPSGCWKSHKENTVDWSEQSNAEIWRQGWALWQNRYLEQNGRPERVDLRSYARQGIDRVPTVHMGPAVSAMERRNIQTDVGNLNRRIRRVNRMMQSIRQSIRDLKDTIAGLRKKEEELSPSVYMQIREWMELRSRERLSWSQGARQKGAVQDLKAFARAVMILEELDLRTTDELEDYIHRAEEACSSAGAQLRAMEKRVKEIDGILAAHENVARLEPVYEAYKAIRWKGAMERYRQAHPEVTTFLRARAYLARHLPDTAFDRSSLLTERTQLCDRMGEAAGPLEELRARLKELRGIRYWTRRVTPGTPESEEAPPKQSILERLRESEPREPSVKKKEEKEYEIEIG